MIETYILATSIFIFAFFRLKLIMMFFQQNEYRNNFFIKFVLEKARLIDKKLTTVLLVIWLGTFINPTVIWAIIPVLIAFTIYESKYLRNAKKKLALTSRVKRIMAVVLILVLLIILAGVRLSITLTAITVVGLLPFLTMLSNIVLSTYENKVQKKFLNEAKEKLKQLNPTVIGITGSYGKTSTKHILAHILNGNLPVLLTPGSVNTEMGITRVVREKLQPEHKFFIVEMGAYFKGSINKLCQLANPKHGIITSIGQAHYEHFKTQEAIAEGKFELGEWITKNQGLLIINSSQIEEKFIPKNMPMIKVGKGSDIYISDLEQTKEGLSFTFNQDGESYPISVPVYGKHQANNIALAIEISLKLGMSIKTIVATLKTLPQTNHRLEVLKKDNGIIMIDDAYNSNPAGFKSGLELLETLKTTRTILVTPGMVELGEVHDEKHLEIGRLAGKTADIVILVGADRIPTFVDGFKETAKRNSQIISVKSFSEARDWMNKHLKTGDIVLLENDLTDMYETRMSL